MLRDLEVLCEMIFSHHVADEGATEGRVMEKPAESAAFGSPRRHAIHALGRLIDLLQASVIYIQIKLSQ